MIFTKLARIVAYLALILGVSQLVIGFGISTEFLGPREEALARYAPGALSSGKVIDRGFYQIIFGIALGTLAEVSFNIRRWQE